MDDSARQVPPSDDARPGPRPEAVEAGRPDAAEPAVGLRLEARRVTSPLAHHGEGPVWDERAGALRWVDMLRGDLLSWRLPQGWDGEPADDAAVERDHLGDVLACVRPRAGGGHVLALERCFALLDDGDLGRVPPRLLPEVWADDSVRFNEGACDPSGRFYVGSMAYDQREGAATLYRLDPDLSVHPVLTGVTVSNGLAWTPDGSAAYYQDTATAGLDRLVLDDAGEVVERSRVREVPEDLGHPDGLAVDEEGCVWSALFGGSAVHRTSPDGELLAVVDVGARQVTACAFGGPDLADLFITTSAEGYDPDGDDDDPLAGALFSVRPGVRGLPVLPFAG
ncbi:SMP-30/gluconolactonase/LRE family protein [uncultured Pseudokineococcus sp.]|uniref:SMP-30/gluconolactonase/LRE family protein n=1 Tax=uncultured Pseudokineococcus sp. TaxID=1642928 RepID=UPI002635B23B|nr:SMP-30/gluconolactonase/LRE family protein [uncultured Pseudokineococcus sp.]